MSSIVRHELETYIDTQRRVLSRKLRKMIAEAVAKRDMDIVAKIESLEGSIETFKPSKAKFITPDEYVDALRSYAFVMSLIQAILTDDINPKKIDVSLSLLELASRGEPIGKIAEDAKIIMGSLDGKDLYFRGCISYLNVLVGKIKDFDPQEIFIAKEALDSIISPKTPVMVLSKLAKLMGVREKDLRDLLARISKSDPNFIFSKRYVLSKTALKEFLSLLLDEKKYVLISELGKEWGLKTSDILEIINNIKDIYPDLLVFNKFLLTTPKHMREYILDLVNSKIALSFSELGAHMGVNEKIARNILRAIIQALPGILVINDELVVAREKVDQWLRGIFGDRVFIYVDEIAGKLGVSNKTAKIFVRELERITGILLIVDNQLYLKDKVSGLFRQGIIGKRDEDIEKLNPKVKELMEAEVYRSIAQVLDEFSKKLGAKG